MIENNSSKLIDDLIADLRSLKKTVKAIPELQTSDTLSRLLFAISEIDLHYVNYCEECDAEGYGEEEGSTYNSKFGFNMEMQIEASDWHQVSILYRKLIAELKLPNVAPVVCNICGRCGCYCEDK